MTTYNRRQTRFALLLIGLIAVILIYNLWNSIALTAFNPFSEFADQKTNSSVPLHCTYYLEEPLKHGCMVFSFLLSFLLLSILKCVH